MKDEIQDQAKAAISIRYLGIFLIFHNKGMTLNGTFNMLLNQIVREKSVPLSLSLASQNSLYADLLVAEDERKNGYVGRSGDELLKDLDLIVAEAEAKYEV